MTKKTLVSLIAWLAAMFVVSQMTAVSADVRCQSQYGGGETCTTTQLLVNKKIWNSDLNAYVDNMTVSSRHFVAGDLVTFVVEIKNTGNTALSSISFSDTLPDFLVWHSGDGLSSTIDRLEPGQTVTKTIVAKVVSDLSSGVACKVNTARATASGTSDSDTAQLCVESRIKGVTTIPQTGPEMGILAVLPALGGLGYFLRKLSLSK